MSVRPAAASRMASMPVIALGFLLVAAASAWSQTAGAGYSSDRPTTARDPFASAFQFNVEAAFHTARLLRGGPEAAGESFAGTKLGDSGLSLLDTSPPTRTPPTTTSPSSPTTPATPGTNAPMPYSPDEFPQWARDLRRGEIVTIGVFPFTLLYTSLAYDLIRFVAESISTGAIATNYAPWFFAPPTKPPLTPAENVGLLVSATTLAVGVGVVDFVLGRVEQRNAASRESSGSAAAAAPGASAGGEATKAGAP